MRIWANHWKKRHAIILAMMLALFSVLTCTITEQGLSPGSEHRIRVIQTTAGTITGPLTGAISRGFQNCCLDFSLHLMAWCSPLLLLGVAVQCLNLPANAWAEPIRISLWSLGWLIWFAGGFVSFLHALD